MASFSKVTVEDQPAPPLIERLRTPTIEERRAFELCQKEKCKHQRANKKTKKDLHGTPPPDGYISNVRVFPKSQVSHRSLLYLEFERLMATNKDFGNPIAENGESLFEAPVQNHNNPFNDNKVNPKHPLAPFYLKLMGSYKVNEDQGAFDPYLNRPSDPEDSSSSEDEDEGMVESDAPTMVEPSTPTMVKPSTPIRPASAPLTRGWHEEETQSFQEGWDDRDNNPDSYAYDDYG
jgi:hypothetical protein